MPSPKSIRLRRNADTRTIDLIFEIEQGPRVYVDKINIVGNTRTLDKVIRRELRFSRRRRLQPRCWSTARAPASARSASSRT